MKVPPLEGGDGLALLGLLKLQWELTLNLCRQWLYQSKLNGECDHGCTASV